MKSKLIAIFGFLTLITMLLGCERAEQITVPMQAETV